MSAVNSEYAIFRDSVARFVAIELAPHHDKWEKTGFVDRSAWRKAGEAGLLCCDLPPELGGPGGDFRHSVVVIEELAKAGVSGPCYSFMLHSDIVVPYIRHYGTADQRNQWIPKMASGEAIGAIAMSEPEAGSDLKAIRTSARCDGNDYVINGQKTFISHGLTADVMIVVAKTRPELGAKGVSLFLVDTSSLGFVKGRALQKLGLKAQDTAEIFFEDLRVPRDCMLGDPEQGFRYLMTQLARERLLIAVAAVASAEGVLERTLEYVRNRKVFGHPVFEFQNSRFRLAEMKAEITVARVFINHCVSQLMQGELEQNVAAIAKLQCTEMLWRVVDGCLQLHGGYGYMWEYPVARSFVDARLLRIFGGTSEIMKELIARSLG